MLLLQPILFSLVLNTHEQCLEMNTYINTVRTVWHNSFLLCLLNVKSLFNVFVPLKNILVNHHGLWRDDLLKRQSSLGFFKISQKFSNQCIGDGKTLSLKLLVNFDYFFQRFVNRKALNFIENKEGGKNKGEYNEINIQHSHTILNF